LYTYWVSILGSLSKKVPQIPFSFLAKVNRWIGVENIWQTEPTSGSFLVISGMLGHNNRRGVGLREYAVQPACNDV
jgi:hypothetical protein